MSDRRREVQELRENVARVDAEICKSLDARASLSKKIHGLLEAEPSADGSEGEWLEKVLANSTGEMPAESVRVIFRAIRAAGRAIEQPVRIAVVGPEGGFCHQSTLEAFGATTQTIECATAQEALAEVTRSRAAFAVFPFESSAEGLQQPTLLSLADSDLVLVAERFLPSSYDLMSTGDEMSGVERVYMTAFAHAACQRFLDAELPRATIIDVRTPKDAADLAREAKSSAAVVPERCGRHAGLERLRENVGDLPDLRIRYGVAGQRPAARTGRDISCLLFSVENEPGSLYEVLRHFSERGINLRKLQSIPARRDGFEYYFYAEITGHASDRPVVTAFESVKRSVRYFRLLGSFPSAS
ncbi:MAG TPA: prephenate dehydratase domain-containing protein [Polyangiaceae bacterium]|nr:prephenate dehydratase domain-containing protein [Polyangiaceae bacterium]